MKEYYLDSAATTDVDEEVLEAMLPYFTSSWYNPSSVYEPAQEIKRKIKECRKTIADSIQADPDEIYFTSGGSESNCWAIQGFCKANQRPLVITTTIEHHSTLACVEDVPYVQVGVDEQGFIDQQYLEKMLRLYHEQHCSILVSFILANNEIGTVQKYEELIPLCKKYNATVHLDAVQFFPYSGINTKQVNFDMMSVSGHKLHAPKGIGFLYIRKSTKISPIIYGSQEHGLRGGTENVPYIVGLAKAVEIRTQQWYKSYDLIKMRDYMIEQLEHRFKCKLNGYDDRGSGEEKWMRLPNNINLTFPQIPSAESFIYMLGESGIYCSAGSACNEGSPEPSKVLTAIGLSRDDSDKTVRFTLPDDITKEDIDGFITRISFILLIVENYE